MELLFTKPLNDWDIILGKFLASFFLVLFALIPTLIYYYTLYVMGNPPGNLDTPGIIGSYLGLSLLAGGFCAVGMLASCITPNQIVAFVMAAFLCFLLFSGFDSISTLGFWSADALFLKQLGILFHYESISRGLVDSRDVIYFLSLIYLLLSITKLILGSRQW
jgi:ABC-2 type transport system permease protein